MNRVCIALLALLVLAPVAAAQSKVGVANPVRIFAEIQETKDMREKLENDRRQLEATERDKRQRLQDLQTRRDALKPDAPQWAELNREYENAVIEFQVWTQVSQVTFQRQQKQQMRNLFDKIVDGVRHVAQQKALDLVIAEQRPEIPQNLDQLNLEQLRVLINQQNVLYSDNRIDISADVITHLDTQYRAGK
jgi:Skp family chaperone for outer membrane proteins